MVAEQKNLYKILELHESCTTDDIKRSYKRLILQYHPDVNKENDAQTYFMNIVHAYKILSDPIKREEYDKRNLAIRSEENQEKLSKDEVIRDLNTLSRRFFEKISLTFNTFRRRMISHEEDNNERPLPFNVDEGLLQLPFEELAQRFRSSSNKYVRLEALKALVIKYNKRAFPYIKAGIYDISREVRVISIKSLGYLRIRQSAAILQKLFETNSVSTRLIILSAAANINTYATQKIILKGCMDEDADVRILALEKLKELKLYHYASEISSLAYDQNQEVRSIAKDILNTIKQHRNYS